LGDGSPEEGFSCCDWLVKWERRVREGVGNELLPRESAAKRRKAAQVHILTTP
jgi:hypothetical protein